MQKWLVLILILGMMGTGSVRAATQYTQEADFAAAIKQEFMEQTGEEYIELEFFGGQTNFVWEDTQSLKIMIAEAKFDELQNKFGVKAEIFADGQPVATTMLQGKYYILGDVYVPGRNINRGEVIKNDDLKLIKVRMNRIKPQNLVDKEKLEGKEAKRVLREGKVVNDKDVGEVMLVKKGQIVSLIYRTEKIQITAKGEVLEDGAKGQKVEVRNTASKKDLYGTVQDADTIMIDVQ